MNNQNRTQLRPVGVTKPPSRQDDVEERQGERRAPPKVVTHVIPAEMYVVRFGDKNGVAQQRLVLKVGGQWLLDENSGGWLNDMKTPADWLLGQIEQRVGKGDAAPAGPVELPETAVSILGGGTR